MNKKEIFERLNNLELDKNKYIIISGASLVVQDIINETPDIDLATSVSYYGKINWDEKIGAFGKLIKVKDCFEISFNLYEKNRFIEINGYKFMILEDILKIKKALNREKDQEVILKLEKILKED
jgi:hypothetical protein